MSSGGGDSLGSSPNLPGTASGPSWTTMSAPGTSLDKTIAPGAGISGASAGLHDVLLDYINTGEMGAALSGRYGLMAPIFLSVGETLPAISQPGQVAFYMADITNTVVWSFMYWPMTRFGVGPGETGYPWVYVGGAPTYAYIGTQENTSSTTWTDLTTVGPSFTVPFAGDYLVWWQTRQVAITGTNQYALSSPQVAGNVTGVAATSQVGGTSGTQNITVSASYRYKSVPANSLIKLQYEVIGAGTMAFADRIMTITPIRVSGQ